MLVDILVNNWRWLHIVFVHCIFDEVLDCVDDAVLSENPDDAKLLELIQFD
jgi:hypothetical protein